MTDDLGQVVGGLTSGKLEGGDEGLLGHRCAGSGHAAMGPGQREGRDGVGEGGSTRGGAEEGVRVDSVAKGVGVTVLGEGGEHTTVAAVGEGAVTTTVGMVGS
eukprot:GFYU01055580.1.p3 GENE.GFYU01055580.1~~GFYU01055580.1.p3  ORF type:complete len:103 (+),score=8.44 GFYU01055580.1:414-722(+)